MSPYLGRVLLVVVGVALVAGLLGVWFSFFPPLTRESLDERIRMQVKADEDERKKEVADAIKAHPKNEIRRLEKRRAELLGLLESGNRADRLSALKELPAVIRSLHRLKGDFRPDLPVVILEAVGDNDSSIQKAATAAAKVFKPTPQTAEGFLSPFFIAGDDAVATLVAYLGHPSPRLRKAAAEALGKIKPEAARVLPALKKSHEIALKGQVRSQGIPGSPEENREVASAISEAQKRIAPDR